MDSSPSLPSSKQTRFVNWLIANGASFPKLEFRADADGCGSVYASADIAEDEVFLTIPFERIVITDALARNHLPLPSASAQLLDSRTAIILFLIRQQTAAAAANQSSDNEEKKEGKESSDSPSSATVVSFYKPYLDMVPNRIHTALEFDDQDMEYLRGTNAYMVVKELKETLRAKYDKTMEIVGDQLSVEQGYTWERFLWAETVISSRTFPASLFGHEVENEIVLIPLADSLNHKSRHKITWIKTAEGLQMSSATTNKGDQVFNNYGPKSNEELLIGYGFCIEDNADDIVTLKTNFSRDPDQERKTEILRYLGVTADMVHYLRRSLISEQLLATMRVMAMNPAEVTRCYATIQDYDQEGEDDEDDAIRERRLENTKLAIKTALSTELQFVSLRNEYAMLDLMDMLLRTKLQGIVEWDRKLSPPQNSAQEFIKVYRQGQMEVLESCAELCRGMFSVLLKESLTAKLSMEQAVFGGTSTQGQGSGTQQRIEPSEFYTPERFKEAALQETKSMSDLKREAVQQVLLNAEGIMMEYKDELFGEAFITAFPDHGWGEKLGDDMDEEEEMAVQMEQDAIVTCFLIFQTQQPERLDRFITAAKMFDFSSQLDEDMRDDVEDLRQSLQETLEEIDAERFDFTNRFTPEAFLWATGLLEVLSLSLHIDGELVSGILAPRDPQAVDGGRQKRKLDQ
ncbi:hypothetical protein BG015_005099 [Linnemannia schmuckeri]|uniref:SET domain-containing protein n=1 Tax=Linnemannia schmuckeri TaxID=64567 RepID=A0A9P5VC79_9FUNG|nr:hypothetical protein BG015_005099 [Linnemannia schmuckeri]